VGQGVGACGGEVKTGARALRSQADRREA
jgi:hypothetical protein